MKEVFLPYIKNKRETETICDFIQIKIFQEVLECVS